MSTSNHFTALLKRILGHPKLEIKLTSEQIRTFMLFECCILAGKKTYLNTTKIYTEQLFLYSSHTHKLHIPTLKSVHIFSWPWVKRRAYIYSSKQAKIYNGLEIDREMDLVLVAGPVAQWITRLTTDQKIPGSNPGRFGIFSFGW